MTIEYFDQLNNSQRAATLEARDEVKRQPVLVSDDREQMLAELAEHAGRLTALGARPGVAIAAINLAAWLVGVPDRKLDEAFQSGIDAGSETLGKITS